MNWSLEGSEEREEGVVRVYAYCLLRMSIKEYDLRLKQDRMTIVFFCIEDGPQAILWHRKRAIAEVHCFGSVSKCNRMPCKVLLPRILPYCICISLSPPPS